MFKFADYIIATSFIIPVFLLCSPEAIAAKDCIIRPPVIQYKALPNLKSRDGGVFLYGDSTPYQMLDCRKATQGAQVDKTNAYFDFEISILNSSMQYAGRTYFQVPDYANSSAESYKVYIAFNLITNAQSPDYKVVINNNHQQIFPVNGQSDLLASYGMHMVDVNILVVSATSAPKSNQLKISPFLIGKAVISHGGTRYHGGEMVLSFDLNFLSETCTFQSKTVNLAPVAPHHFFQSNEVGETPFNLNVSCPTSMDGVVSYALLKDSNAATGNFDGRLKNVGSAKNIAIKLYSNQVAVPVSSQLYTPSSIMDETDLKTQFPYAFTFGQIQNRQATHAFKAVYEKLSSADVQPGTVLAEAMLDVFYP